MTLTAMPPDIGLAKGRKLPLRPLRHLASSVRHQQYYDSDIVTVRVDRPSD